MRKNRRTEAVVEQNGQRFRVMKGAMRTIAEACGVQPPEIEAFRGAGQRIGNQGISDAGGRARPRDGHLRIARIGDAL